MVYLGVPSLFFFCDIYDICALSKFGNDTSKIISNTTTSTITVLKAFASAGVDPALMGIGPVPATQKLLNLTGVSLDEIGVIELNEAFSAQALACIREWGLEDDDPRINPNGGAIAIGHPLGASGTRILQTASIELNNQNKKYALVTMCVGVGQGYATIIKKV